jgi:hypothetical protein
MLREAEDRRRERTTRHAMRNMVAAISMAAEVLEGGELEEPVRRRLEHTIFVEATRLRCLLEETAAALQSVHHDGRRAVPDHSNGSAPDAPVPPVTRIFGETDVDHHQQKAKHA